jgi:hypothetical protein
LKLEASGGSEVQLEVQWSESLTGIPFTHAATGTLATAGRLTVTSGERPGRARTAWPPTVRLRFVQVIQIPNEVLATELNHHDQWLSRRLFGI